MKNYYHILGISKNANLTQIKKAYRKLALKHHPDRGGDENKFKEISEAYEVLSDQNKKRQYDRNHNTHNFSNSFNSNPMNMFNQMFWRKIILFTPSPILKFHGRINV